MKRVSRYLLLLCGVAVLAGCNRHAGVFVSTDNQEHYIELKSDGTFAAREGPMVLTGNYEIHGDILTLRLPNGVFANSIIRGNAITDRDGETFVKGPRPEAVKDAKAGTAQR